MAFFFNFFLIGLPVSIQNSSFKWKAHQFVLDSFTKEFRSENNELVYKLETPFSIKKTTGLWPGCTLEFQEANKVVSFRTESLAERDAWFQELCKYSTMKQ